MNITITDNAIKRFKQNLEKQPDAVGLRISIKATGCNGYSYILDYASEVNQTEKISGENYNLKRVYSPYLSPSHLVVEQMTLNQSIAPVFVHNSARTKSFFVSKPAVPSDHNKINIYA